MTQAITKTQSSPMSKIEARQITDQINQKSNELWALLKEASDRHAWSALGYKNWRDYATAEFDVSQSYAYRLLDQATVITAIQEAANSPTGENSPIGEISELAARQIKPKLAKVVEEIKSKVAKGADPVKTTYEVIEATRVESKPAPKPTKPAKNAPTIESLQAEVEALRGDLTEAHDIARDLAHQLESYETASGDVKAAAKELTTLKGMLYTVETQRDSYMTKCNEMVKSVNYWKRKAGGAK
jgi:DNA repair exonuclease SbcCD ATPase subunit